MGMISWMSNEIALAVLSMGLPGLIFLMFIVHSFQTWRMMRHSGRESAARDKERAEDRARYDKERAEDRTRYDKALAEAEQRYVNNVSLVKRYNELSSELMGTVRLNTQALTQLVDNVKNNQFCPQLREKGPNR